MGYDGNWDHYSCDHCIADALIRKGTSIDEYPSWTNQNWSSERMPSGKDLILCPKCSRKWNDIILHGMEDG